MGLLKTRKNKKFNYTPRYYDDNGEGNPYHIKYKFDEYRKTVGDSTGLKSKFKAAWEDFRYSKDKATNRRVLIIISILILIFLFVIDFDLSIFF